MIGPRIYLYLFVAFTWCERFLTFGSKPEVVVPRFAAIRGGNHISDDRYWPWLVLVKGQSRGEITTSGVVQETVLCGGSIIDEYNIISAAHCFDRWRNSTWKFTVQIRRKERPQPPRTSLFDRLRRIFGLRNRGRRREGSKSEDTSEENNEEKPATIQRIKWESEVVDVTKHEHFLPSQKWKNDIAIVRVRQKIPIGDEGVGAARITDDDAFIVKYQPGGLSCAVAGWGCRYHGGPPQIYPLQGRVHITPASLCRRIFNDSSIGMSKICASSTPTDGGTGFYLPPPFAVHEGPCLGDSGGPLVCLRTGGFITRPKYILVGIVSFGIARSRRSHSSIFSHHRLADRIDFPHVYSRVAHYAHWIQRKLGKGSSFTLH